MSGMIKTYTELTRLPTFQERFEYLKLDGSVGIETFGFDRYGVSVVTRIKTVL